MPFLTPKERFQKTPAVKAHAELVHKDEFHQALETALAEMELQMPAAGVSAATAWDSHSRMVGAREFITVLLNLAEPPAKPKPLPRKDLVYKPLPPTLTHTKE